MKLISLQIIGKRSAGWSSKRLLFADHVTQIFGENGCGKTPVVKAIVFALGYPVAFRDDILDRCDEVALEVAVGSRQFTIVRRLTPAFDVSVQEHGGNAAIFANDREYSRFLLSIWNLEDPTVMTVQNASTSIYANQILPLFYLDQDHGYSEPYYSPKRFIKDQYAEVTRLVFGLAPKNSYDKKRDRNELKERLEYADRVVARLEKELSELFAELGGPRKPIDEIDGELRAAIDGLESVRASGGSNDQINLELDTRISQLQRRSHKLTYEKAELNARIRGYFQIRNEIEVEANTLSLNEEARRVFSSFDAVCANDNCGLFVRSSVTYGKSLLYLRDQIKDLERTSATHKRRADEITEEIAEIASQISEVQISRAKDNIDASVSKLVSVVSELTGRVIALNRMRQIELETARLELLYIEKLEDRAKLQARIVDLENSSGTADVELMRLRNAFTERVNYWLGVLGTSNIGSEIKVDSDFGVTLSGQRLNKFTGSTLTRIILAIRTAAFDLIVQKEINLPKFLILDAPRQQDITRDDLSAYILQLKLVAKAYNAQIVFSSSNYRYDLDEGDVEWNPDFPGEDHLMFLGESESEDLA